MLNFQGVFFDFQDICIQLPENEQDSLPLKFCPNCPPKEMNKFPVPLEFSGLYFAVRFREDIYVHDYMMYHGAGM